MMRLRVLRHRIERRPDMWWAVAGKIRFGRRSLRRLWRVGNYEQ